MGDLRIVIGQLEGQNGLISTTRLMLDGIIALWRLQPQSHEVEAHLKYLTALRANPVQRPKKGKKKKKR